VAAVVGASRFERNRKARPSRVHAGAVSFFSAVKVSCLVDDTPSFIDTRKRSVCRRASFQSGNETV